MEPTETKIKAEYQNNPKGTQQCNKCTMFRRPNSCTLVIGYILPQGWCKHFERK